MLHITYNCYMLFFNTKFGIYLRSQSPGFKLDTISKTPGFKPGAVSQSPGFKPDTAIQSPGFKPGIDAIHLPYFQTQAFKKFKISNQPIILSNKELRNPDSLSLIEIRRSKVKSLSGPSLS